ncbi:sensor histidine kinase [Rhodococcus marinonascens]|uniref:sensor histidine kinase n=1 Tax=Rhodococcus marinonascens TaxID=38311 RepID=UPI0009352386|nr:HAMP domain-containing sensor histidine kinase [Rhodococcus marinonascens]
MTTPVRSLSVRARVAWAAGLAAALVVLLVAALTAINMVGNEYQQRDRRVEAVAEALGGNGNPITRGRGYVATVRLDGTVLQSTPVRLPPAAEGLTTEVVDGVTYRVRTRALGRPEGALLSVGIPQPPIQAVVGRLAPRLAVAGVLAVVLAALLGWLFAGRAVRPLRQLITQTRTLTADGLHMPPRVRGAAEAEELAEAITDMWSRMNSAQERTWTALDSARGFAASAAHELRTPLTAMRTDLDIVRTHPLSKPQLDEIVGDLIRTQRRVESTVTALGQLAAGELMRPEDRIRFDVTELFDRVAQECSRTHPAVHITVRGDLPVTMTGWPDGIRLASDNLLRNAITHGGATEIELSAVPVETPGRRPALALRVDDNGVGLPVDERQRVLHRFERGSAARAAGSGLGLALVSQQAALHGGDVVLSDSRLGGLCVTLTVDGS